MSFVRTSRRPLVGRTAELTTLEAALAAPGLVTLIGPGGAGKTRLATEVAARHAALDPVFVWLDEISHAEEIAGQLRIAVGLPLEASARQLVDALEGPPSRLLVLDNAEHVLDAVRALVPTLPLDRLRVVVTSRAALDLPGERRVKVDALPVADARELLARCAAQHGVELDADPDELLHALDCLPLAIELAAARTTILSPAQILDRLQSSNAVVGSAAPTRHGTLDRTVAWSWDLLDEGERAVAATVAWFDVPVTPGWVVDMWPTLDVLSIAQALEAKSWLRVVDGARGKRWTTLWAMRRFVAHLVDPGMRRQRQQQLTRWAAEHVRESPGWWADHVPAAIAAAAVLRDEGQPELAAQVLARSFFGAFGTPRFGQALDAAVELLESWDRSDAPAVWADLAAKVAKGAFRYAGKHRATVWSARAVEAAPRHTLAWLTAGAQHVLCLLDDGAREEAEALLSELVHARDALVRDLSSASALLDLGTAAHELGRFDLARESYGTVAQLGRRAGNVDAEARALIHLAYASYDLGEFDRAAAEIGQLERLMEDRHPHETAVTTGVVPAMLAMRAGRADESRRLLDELERLARDARHSALEFFVAVARAEWASRYEPHAVAGHLDRASALARAADSHKSLAQVEFLRAVDEIARGANDDARRRIRALREARRPASPQAWCDALDALDWIAAVPSAPHEPAPPTAFGQLARAAHASIVAGDDKPLRELLEREPASRWLIGGLYLCRLDDIADRWVRARSTSAPRRLKIWPQAQRFQLDDGPIQDMSRRGAARRILARLVDEPGRSLSAEEAIAVGWPGEQILHDAALKRVYTTINRLRTLGLGPWLVSTDSGYQLDPRLGLDRVGTSDELVERLRAARERKRSTTGRCEGVRPFGEHPGEAEIVAYIKQLRRKKRGAARLSFARIAERLNAEGVPTRHGGPWQPSTVAAICGR